MKYPNGKVGKTYKPKPNTSVKNRGMTLEKIINASNLYYLEQGKAVIHKKPTPVQIVNVSYPSRNKAKITEAYYQTPSTTDYNGIYKGYYVDFDVKESKNKTSFPLKNIHAHQIDHLRSVHEHGGLAFLIIHLKADDTFWLLPYSALAFYVNRAIKGRKSMTHEELKKESLPIREGLRPRLDYLKTIDQWLEKT
ncbi:MAG: Holliday junction resolvase RecU [Bacillota bacterium]